MAKTGYILRKSNYTLSKKNKSLDGGDIFSRDYMTLNNSNYTSDAFPYGESNFRISIHKDSPDTRDHSFGDWLSHCDGEDGENCEVWTLSNVSGTTQSSESSIEIKPDYSDLKSFVHYGSCYELLKNAITNIINTFPGELYVTDKTYKDVYCGNANDPDFWSEELKDPVVVSNPFDIDIVSLKVPTDGSYNANYDDEDVLTKYFCKSYNKYVIIKTIDGTSKDTWPVTGVDWESIPTKRKCARGIGLSAVVKISDDYNPNEEDGDLDYSFLIYQYYVNGRFVLLCEREFAGTHIRPLDKYLEQFYNNLTGVENLLLNRTTNPIYTMKIYVPYETEDGIMTSKRYYTWPVLNDWNLDIESSVYSDYINSLLDVAELYDEYYTNNLWKNMVHDSIKNMDLTYTNGKDSTDSDDYKLGLSKMEKLMYSYGFFFDMIKRYIDNIKSVNKITYDGYNNNPDYFLTDTNELSGWEVYSSVKSLRSDAKTEELYSSTTYSYNVDETNVEFLRNLRINSRAILSRKGTKDGIEMLLGLFGMKSYDFQRAVYNNLPEEDKIQVKNTYCVFTIGTKTVKIPKLNTIYNINDVIDVKISKSDNNAWSNSEDIYVKAVSVESGDKHIYYLQLVNTYCYHNFLNRETTEFSPLITKEMDFTAKNNEHLLPTIIHKDNLSDYPNVDGVVVDEISDVIKSLSLAEKILEGKVKTVTETYEKFEDIDDYTKSKLYDYKIDEYVCVAKPKGSNYIFDSTSNSDIEIYNSFKKTFENTDDALEGLPLAEVTFNDGEKDKKYYIPWFDKNKKYDGDLYFQMKGGWGKINKKFIDSKISDVTEIEGDFYDETVKYLTLINHVVGLKSIKTDNLRDNMIVKVTEEDDMKEAVEDAFGIVIDTESSGMSEYFILLDSDNNIEYGEDAWFNIPKSDIENGTNYGINVLYIESLTDNNKGNAPHSGYGEYDDGKEYLEYFKQIFKYSIENDNFNNNGYLCDNGTLLTGITEYGFDNIIDENNEVNYVRDNMKCWYFSDNPDEETYNGPYLTKYNTVLYEDIERCSAKNPVTKVVALCDDGDFEDREMNTANADIVNEVGSESMDNLYESDLYTFDFVDGTVSGHSENSADSIINTKKMKITFNISEDKKYTTELRKYLKECVTPYLKQMIPSGTIYEIAYPDDIAETNNNMAIADAASFVDDTEVLSEKYTTN